MKYRYDTFCGLYCGACVVLQANQDNTLQATAQAWGVEPEQLRCHGCKTEVNSVYCADCDIKSCAQSRGVEYCFQCTDYVCERLSNFRDDEHAHHSIVLQNLERIRSIGIEQWLKEQGERWTCAECGAGFSWYEQSCAACGAQVYNCQDEQARLDGESP